MCPKKRSLSAVYIDDNGAEAILLARLVRQIDWLDLELRHYSMPRRAMSELLANPPDIVFLDHHLGSSQTGLDLLCELREGGISIPIVMMTGTDDPGILSQFLRYGADAYLHKTDLDPGKVASAIEVALTSPHNLLPRIVPDAPRRR